VLSSLRASESLQGAEERINAQQRDFHALVGLLRLKPENVERVVTAYAKGEVGETLLTALSAASTSESLGALGRLAQDAKLPNATRLKAAASFVRAGLPP
jgi:hypothetical protein